MAMNPIVIAISADTGQLSSGVAKGSESLVRMERDGKKLRAELDRISAAGVAFQQKVSAFAGVSDKIAQSARSSAQAFAAFDAAKGRIDSMRASFDPVFAASKRYEQAVHDLDAALEMGVLTAKQHADMVERVGTAYLGAADELTMMHGRMGGIGSLSDKTRGKIQQVGFQVQDFAVQVGAGTSATQAFAQQFPQLAGAFGPVGVVIGTLAAIGIPLLSAAFSGASEEAKGLAETLDDADTAIGRFQSSIDAARAPTAELTEKYGELAGEARAALDAIANADRTAALKAVTAEVQAINSTLLQTVTAREALLAGGGVRQMVDQFGLLQSQANAVRDALVAMESAKGPEQMAAAATRLMHALDGARDSAGNLPPPLLAAYTAASRIVPQVASIVTETDKAAASARAMGGAFGYAASRAYDVRVEAARTAAAIAEFNAKSLRESKQYSGRGEDPRKFMNGPTSPEVNTFDGNLYDPKQTSGGGQGGAVSELDSLRQSLMTQEEVQLESYARQQEMLQTALQQRQITQQDYLSLMEQAQRQHQATMSEIDVWRYGDGQQKAAAFFGVMADTLQSGNERMQKIARTFGAAEALINAWRAYAQTIGDPTIPFMAKFALAANVFKAGMSAAQAIKGGSGSSSSGVSASGGGAAAPAAQQNAATYMNFQFTGGWASQEAMGRFMVDSINEAVKNGATIKGARYT